MTDKVSIIIPVYNALPYLRTCIESVLSQTYGKELLEVILVDDGSTDGSSRILDEYAAVNECVKAIHLDENSGRPGLVRNVGIDTATGDWLYFIDSDDWVGDRCIELLMAHAKEWGSDTIQGRLIECDYAQQKGATGYFASSQQSIPNASIERDGALSSSLGPIRMVRRDILEKESIRFPEESWYEDLVFSLRVLFSSEVCSLANDYDYYFVRRDSDRSGGISNATSEQKKPPTVKRPEAVVAGIEMLFGIMKENMVDGASYTKVFKKLFTHPVRMAMRNITEYADAYPDEYGANATQFCDKVWSTVGPFYTDDVRRSLLVSDAIINDYFSSGCYDFLNLRLLRFIHSKPLRKLSTCMHCKATAPQGFETSGGRPESLRFLTETTYKRLLLKQWECARVESFRFYDNRSEGCVYEGSYFYPLCVTSSVDLKLGLVSADGDVRFATAIELSPQIWGEPWQAKGEWRAVFPDGADPSKYTLSLLFADSADAVRAVPIDDARYKQMQRDVALLDKLAVPAVDSASFEGGVLSCSGVISGSADATEARGLRCALVAKFYEVNGDGPVTQERESEVQLAFTPAENGRLAAPFTGSVDIGDVDVSAYANGGVWKITLRYELGYARKAISLGSSASQSVKDAYLKGGCTLANVRLRPECTKWGNFLIRALV